MEFTPSEQANIVKDIAKAVTISVETVRGETLVMDITKDGKILGIDIFAPGIKPCQPAWAHTLEEVLQ